MSSPFNTYLRGMLGFLDAKVGGRSPNSFADDVQLTLDAQQFIYAQQRILQSFSTAAFGTGAEGFAQDSLGVLTVPDGELWYVMHHSVSAAVSLLAAEELAIAPAIRGRSTSVGILAPVPLNQPSYNSLVGARPCNAIMYPYWALPGDQVGVWVQNVVTAATLAVDIRLASVKVPI